MKRTHLLTYIYGRARRVYEDENGNLFFRVDHNYHGTHRSYCFSDAEDVTDLTKLTIIDSYVYADGSNADGNGFIPDDKFLTVNGLYEKIENETRKLMDEAEDFDLTLYAVTDDGLLAIPRCEDPITAVMIK